MNSIILCEGSTDYFLLQYYMREAYQWADDKRMQENVLKMPKQKSRNLVKGANVLTVMSVGGCSKLGEGLKTVLSRNKLSSPDLSNAYRKIAIVTDRDEVGTEQSFLSLIQMILSEFHVECDSVINNNTWVFCKMYNQIGVLLDFAILLMIIPFQENGAMETFLLNAIRKDNPYDKAIIDTCNLFVDNIDPEQKYLTSRRYVTKAKFDTYFSIRTPAEQFMERQNILKNVRWEQYTQLQADFQKLADL